MTAILGNELVSVVGIQPSTLQPSAYAVNTAPGQFGNGVGYMPETGDLYRLVSQPGLSPASTAANIVLAVYSMPASSFDIAQRGLMLTAHGSFAANANTKTVNIVFGATTAVVGTAVTGGTVVATTGASVGSGVGYRIQANVYKYGVAGSNTQIGMQASAIVGATALGVTPPVLTTVAENAVILIAVTGNSATTTTDIVQNLFEVAGKN